MVSNLPMENSEQNTAGAMPANHGSDDSANVAELQQRISELEIKASFAEDLLDQLDQIVFRQQRQIEVLARELSDLKRRMPEGGANQARNLRDDLPPHY